MSWIKFVPKNLIVYNVIVIGAFFLFVSVRQVSASSFSFYHAKSSELHSGKNESSSGRDQNTQISETALQNQSLQLRQDTIPAVYGQQEPAQLNQRNNPSELLSDLDNKTILDSGETENLIEEAVTNAYRNYLVYELFGEQNLLQLKNSMLKYGRNNLAGSSRILYNSLIDQFFHYPIIIVFIFLILFFVVHIVFILLVLNYSTRLKNYNEKYTLIYKEYYEKITLSYLFDEIDWTTYVSRLKKIKKFKNRKILIAILLNLHDNLKGGFETPIVEIYNQLHLEKDSIRSIHSFLYHHKVSGLHQLINLNPSGAIKVLPKLLNHSNGSVRAEAQKAYILLHPDKPFHFLRTLDKSFSRWTQLSAFNLLRLPHLNVPSFSRYIGSKHRDVRVFCLQMIVYFQQYENSSLIFNVLESRHELIRFLAYNAINDLRLYEGKSTIKQNFRNETERNKKEIIKALCNIGTTEDIDFLEIIFKSESIGLQIEACRTLYFMSPESKNRLLSIKKKVKPDLDLFVAHITDLRN